MPRAPIVIGGVGGSGTRVVCQILKERGLFVGKDLNRALDNLSFTFLLKRPQKLQQDKSSWREVHLNLLANHMQGAALDKSSRKLLRQNLLAGDSSGELKSFLFRWKRYKHLKKGVKEELIGQPWGWKEPNSHIFLEDLVHVFGPEMKYVHVIRHGLDMAFSRNKQQMANWGHLYGVAQPTGHDAPAAQLNYWINANQQAVAKGSELLGDNFLLLNYDALCEEPLKYAQMLLDFSGLLYREHDLELMATIPRTPKSKGRYLSMGLDQFSSEQIAAVRELGFAVEG